MRMKAVAAGLFFTVSATAFAGSWSSGGTELMGDTRNPWFLSNTRQATYCILLDEQNSGVTRPEASALITRTLAFWAREFHQAVLPIFPDFGRLEIATQSWQERPCADSSDESVDLRFQFGVLNREQEDYIKSPKSYAAISVRTAYDKVQLRGKGFIYVSPVHGRLAYQGAAGKPNLWSERDGANLYPILLHELGHVFGLPHMGALGQLMSEGFAETFLAALPGSFDQFFGLPPSKEFCPTPPLLGLLRDLFGMTDSAKSCLRLKYTHDQTSPLFKDSEMQAYAVSGPADDGMLLGTATLRLTGFFATFGNYIWLSPEQNVFSPKDLVRWGTTKDRVPGITMFRFTKRGSFHAGDGRPGRSISVSFEQGNPVVSGSGVVNGELYDSFF